MIVIAVYRLLADTIINSVTLAFFKSNMIDTLCETRQNYSPPTKRIMQPPPPAPPPPKKKTEIKIAGINSRFPSVSESEILRKGGAINTRKTGREQSLTCDILNVKEVGIESK